MRLRVGCWLALGIAAAGLACAGWPGVSASPATLVNRVEVIAAPVLLTSAGRAARRVFGPAGGSRLARMVRAGGYAAVLILFLVKAGVERFEYAGLRGGAWLAGLWVGEIIFVVVIAAYVAGLTAVTASRPPAGPAALALGTAAGAVAGLVLVMLPPLGNPLHVPNAWLAVVHGVARGVALPLAMAGGVIAGLAAARRTPRRGSRLLLAESRARQGLAAGACAGAAAALVVSVAGVSAAALLPHRARPAPPAVANLHHLPLGVQDFEVSLSRSAAGYLLVLVFFPVLGAGLGAWGGLGVAGRPAPPPGDGGAGGGGGGSGGSPEPGPQPMPTGRRDQREDGRPFSLAGYLFPLPAGAIPSREQEDQDAPPGHRERAPVGGRSRSRCRSVRPRPSQGGFTDARCPAGTVMPRLERRTRTLSGHPRI